MKDTSDQKESNGASDVGALLEREFTRIQDSALTPEHLRLDLMTVAERFRMASARTGDQALRNVMVVLWALTEADFQMPDEWAKDARAYFKESKRGPRDLGEKNLAREKEYLCSGIQRGVSNGESPEELAERFIRYLRMCTQLVHRTRLPPPTVIWDVDDRENAITDIAFEIDKFYPQDENPEKIVREALKAVGYEGSVKDLFNYVGKREARSRSQQP